MIFHRKYSITQSRGKLKKEKESGMDQFFTIKIISAKRFSNGKRELLTSLPRTFRYFPIHETESAIPFFKNSSASFSGRV